MDSSEDGDPPSVENPLASSASEQEGVKQQQQEGAPATEGFIACPSYLSNFDRLLCARQRAHPTAGRINSFDVDSHNRLLILETAMEKSNHGQGIGFCVLGVVIDKPRLWAYTNKFMGLVTFIAPFLATWCADQ
jgi:hypothetical protein